MIPEITTEMREAFARTPWRTPSRSMTTRPARSTCSSTARADAAVTEQWLREQLKIGLAAADQGDVVTFNADEIKGAGRVRLAGSG